MQNKRNNRLHNKKQFEEKDIRELFANPKLQTIKHDEFSITMNREISPLDNLYQIHECIGLYSQPTLIQKFAIPAMSDNSDILVKAPTGMGKTMCFLLHAMRKIEKKGKPSALVISPVRELAEQIKNEAHKISRKMNVRVDALYGGAVFKNVNYSMTDLLIATPGRLIDFLQNKKIDLSGIDTFILDEADQLLDMGFDEAIKEIYGYIPNTAQVCLFSATYKRKLYDILKTFLKEQRTLIEVNLETPNNIVQEFLFERDKKRKLLEILRSSEYSLKTSWRDDVKRDKMLVFVQRKADVDELEEYLKSNGISCRGYHGDKDQSTRASVLNQFKSDFYSVLIATSVAARGIDVKDIKLVINFDTPSDIKEYIHRIGRTGREGKTGKSITFYDDHAPPGFKKDLIELLKSTGNKIPSFITNRSQHKKTADKSKPTPLTNPVADPDINEEADEVAGLW